MTNPEPIAIPQHGQADPKTQAPEISHTPDAAPGVSALQLKGGATMTTTRNSIAQSPHPKEASTRPLPPPGRRPQRAVIITVLWLIILVGGGAAGAMVPLPDLRLNGTHLVYSSVITGISVRS